MDIDLVRKAMKRCFALGEVYFQQGDSDSYIQNAKADTTFKKFDALVDETCAALVAPQHCTTCDGTGDVHREDGEWLGECHCIKEHRAALDAGDLMAIAEECGGLRIAENIAQVTKEDLARIIQFSPPAAPVLSDEEIDDSKNKFGLIKLDDDGRLMFCCFDLGGPPTGNPLLQCIEFSIRVLQKLRKEAIENIAKIHL